MWSWWSDGEFYQYDKRRLTGIQVAVKFYKITRLRVAFDNREWGTWRWTANEWSNNILVEQPALLLPDGEEIIGVTTHTDGYGQLVSLELTLSTGRRQFWGDTDTRDMTRIKSVLEKSKLAYLSGGMVTTTS